MCFIELINTNILSGILCSSYKGDMTVLIFRTPNLCE